MGLKPPASSPDEQRHAADVFGLGSKRRRDGSFGLGQGNPDVSGSQGPAVIGPVPAHAHPVATGIEGREKQMLNFRNYTMTTRDYKRGSHI